MPHPMTATFERRPERGSVLARMAGTGIYLLHGIPRDLQRAARGRSVRDGVTLRAVLVQALREYAAGSWTPATVDGQPHRREDT